MRLNSFSTWQTSVVKHIWQVLLLIQEAIRISKSLVPRFFPVLNFYNDVKDQWVDSVNFSKPVALFIHETTVILWKYFLQSSSTFFFFMTSNKMFLRYLAHLTSMSHMLPLGSVTWCSFMWRFRVSDEYMINGQTWSEEGSKMTPDYITPW